MTVYLVPGVFGAGGQILDSNGKPLSGALVNTYAAGTTSQVVTFTTINGNVTAANPIVTGADGRLPYELWQSENQAIKIVLTDSLANTLGTYDNLRGINDPFAISGLALLNSNNNWTGQNTFSNISANSITVTSITVSTQIAANLNVSTINSSTISVSSMTINTVTAINITVSNLTVSGASTIGGKQIGRTVTGTITSVTLGPSVQTSTVITHGLGTNDVQILLSCKVPSANENYIVFGVRNDGSYSLFKGVGCSVTTSAPAFVTTSGTISILQFNTDTVTQRITTNYMVIG